VVQQIYIYWGRTGPNGGYRKSIRDAVKIPVQRLDCKDPKIVYHQASYSNFNHYVQPYDEILVHGTRQPVDLGGVTVDYTQEEVSATFRYNYRYVGKPDRSWVEKTLILPANEWGQIRYNGRFTTETSRYCRTVVVNVGLFDRLTPGLFTQQEAISRFASIAKLGR